MPFRTFPDLPSQPRTLLSARLIIIPLAKKRQEYDRTTVLTNRYLFFLCLRFSWLCQGLPADFPADFPLPQGADAQGGAGGAGRDVVAIFQADGSVEDVSAFFSAELPAAGYEITQSTGDGSTGQVYSVSGNGWTGEVAIGQSVGTSFTVSLDRQE